MKIARWSAMLLFVSLTACDPQTLSGVIGSLPSSTSLSNEEVIQGLKEALTVGTRNAVTKTAAAGGFNQDPVIRIPFPEEAQQVKVWANQMMMGGKVTAFENTMNQAAEKAAAEAVPVFVNAITGMTIQDGFSILRGDSLAATTYLKQKTTAELTAKFRPIVDRAIDEVNLTSLWEPLAEGYNATTLFSGKPQVNTDLGAYVTERALGGLFYYVGVEEKKIRRDPAARVSDILVRVFGSIDR
jgi:hypothetical protein